MNTIETIARGVCIVGGKVLLCRGKGAANTYLPGGHIEFGEKGREALEREMMEETGCRSRAGRLLGVVESSFMQNGERHCEINLVYDLELLADPAEATAKEDWIEFEWRPIGELGDANLLPQEMAGYVTGDGSEG